MSEPETYYCDYEISPARWHVDPEPAEHCETEVANDGDRCPEHGGEDEPDYDQIRKDRILDERES